MDNCDLEKLSISGGKLQPAFKSSVTSYKVTVASNVNNVTLDLLTSDCGASYKIFSGDGSKTIQLNDGINVVDIEVVAEDGTSKKYSIEVTKLSARTAVLSELSIEGDVQLHPAFSANIYEYSSTVSFYCNTVTMLPKIPDKNMKVLVNGEGSFQFVSLNVGDTMVEIKVCSADGSNSQIYTVSVTREQIPMAVTFSDAKDCVEYECPVSLTALYRPVSIYPSEPKHIFSGPYIDMLARRSKVDPLNESPLGDSWKVLEPDLDGKMSAALVKCFFAYRGCGSVVKLAEVGSHALRCPHKPSADLDPKDVTETSWYKKYFASSSNLEIETKHTLEVRNWEKKLQKAIGEDSVDNLCTLAQDHLKLYRQRLPKPGDMLQYEEGQSPLDSLEQVAIHYASAIKLKPKDPRFHFLLGQALEEQHRATEMYGLKKRADGDSEELSGAKATSLQDDILALCKLHGFTGTPTLENQLKAVDTEYHQLKEQGQSGKADYVQTLYIWLSKRAGKDGSAGLRDKESCMHRASLKYLDAWSLSPDDWEFNLHTGRLLLLQGLEREALQHLQTGLALRPSQPALRFYTGLALLRQGGGASEEAAKEAAGFLQQGLEHVIAQYCSDRYGGGSGSGSLEQLTRGPGMNSAVVPSGVEQAVWEPLSSVSTHFLRGCLALGAALQQNTLPGKTMSGEQVYHIIAVLAAQGVCRCVCRGEVVQQLEWVLLDAHFALLQGLMLAKPGTERQASVAKRCQALAALIRLTAIAPCRELLDMQEKVCQVAVVTTPRDGHALYLLGLAQLAQFDNDPESERSKVDLADACLSFQASLELEDKPQGGDPPAQLTKQKWWQEKLASEKEKGAKQTASQSTGTAGPSDGGAAGRGSGRGRGGPGRGGATTVAKATAPAKGGAKAAPHAKPPVARGRAGAATAPRTDGSSRAPGKPSSKTQLSPSKSKTDCSPSSTKAGAPQESAVAECPGGPTPVNRRSHAPRLGLARALSRNADTHDQACQFYQEVISMAPEVHDAYIELAEMLVKSDPLAAVEVYCRFPLRPGAEQGFDDAFITGEIIRNLMKLELYDHPQLGANLVAYGKVMGLGCIEKYIEILDGKFKTHLLKSVYAGIHNKSVDDKDLQDFFKFKCWL